MAEVVTSKTIDLRLLSAEMGGAELSMTAQGGTTTVRGEVTQAALEAAVAAHVAPDYAAQATNETSIRDKAASALDTNKTFLALTSPTNAQIAAQVKALTRQNNGLIRLILRRFDAAD